jgi:hypothetical protein
MTDHDADHGSDDGRSTAPQSEYTTNQVGTGIVVALVGLLVAFGVPLLLLA